MVKNFISILLVFLIVFFATSYCEESNENYEEGEAYPFMKRSLAIGRMGFRPGKRSYLDYMLREDMDPDFDEYHNFNYAIKRSAALGRLNFRPAKRSLALGRSGFRPGKRSVALGRQKFRPGK
uniref:Short neuropeptide F n=1 Tax=Strongyloides venezuelensis TaxID=75913 RepID=A0A0K0FNN3_STRVS